MSSNLNKTLQDTVERLVHGFKEISPERKAIIDRLTKFITQKSKTGEKILLNFICTHNSRRSHISQIWAQTAAYYYDIKNLETFSGGTEATAFNPRAVAAMKDAGFQITIKEDGANPVYEVKYTDNANLLTVFSKKYDDRFNPQKDFAAIMTCSHADENCPVVIGASIKIPLTYQDPKDFDGTSQEAAKYTERVMEIGREILYAFSQVR